MRQTLYHPVNNELQLQDHDSCFSLPARWNCILYKDAGPEYYPGVLVALLHSFLDQSLLSLN